MSTRERSCPAVIPADHRFTGFPLPLVVHILGATTYALVGILQFVPRFRRRHLSWHRRPGRRRPALSTRHQQAGAIR
jgi:hypothetical protein